jgi:hypothetical protein
VSKYYTLKPRKFSIEFHDWRQANAHGGQSAVAALLDQFGLKDRVRRESALDPRTHKGRGFAPLVYVTQLLYSFTSGGVVARAADRLAATLLGVGQRIGERIELKISVVKKTFAKAWGGKPPAKPKEYAHARPERPRYRPETTPPATNLAETVRPLASTLTEQLLQFSKPRFSDPPDQSVRIREAIFTSFRAELPPLPSPITAGQP